MKFSEECRSAAAEWWEGSFVHPFVQGIGDGTLPIDRFKYYVLQDSYYLTHFAKVQSFGCRLCEGSLYNGADGKPCPRYI